MACTVVVVEGFLIVNCLLFVVCVQDAGETLATHFNLADNVFARATVTPCDRVCLWLGVSSFFTFPSCNPLPSPILILQANVMLEYDYDEAEKLLSENLAGARRKLVWQLAYMVFAFVGSFSSPPTCRSVTSKRTSTSCVLLASRQRLTWHVSSISM